MRISARTHNVTKNQYQGSELGTDKVSKYSMSNIQKSEIKYFDVTEGDYNDVYRRFYLKGTEEQVEKFVRDEFDGFDEDEIEDLGSDSIGLGVMQKGNDPQGYQYYVEAQEVDKADYFDLDNYDNKKFFYHPLYDLTK